MTPYPTAVTIAGSDSGGGAGIQADLKTFLGHRVFGMSVICAVTAQNTRGVLRVDPIPVAGVRAQLDAVFGDLPVGAVKIGMLGTAELTRCVAERLATLPVRPPIVVDPVMVASTGARLMDDDAVRVLMRDLLPLATLVTPNLDEIAVLSGSDDRTAQLRWADEAPCAVLITGGDTREDLIVDTLRHQGPTRAWSGPRFGHLPFHGTGCTLSSAIAARLATGEDLESAVDGAISYVRGLIALADAGGSVGGGNPVLPHGLYANP